MSNKNKLQDENHSFDSEFLEKLIVGIGEVSRITSIPTRQLRYWEEKNIITSLTEEEGKNRRYDYKNIKKILLIKELVDDGYSLDGAVKKVEERIKMIENSISKILNNSK